MAIVKPVSFKEKETDLLEFIKDKDFTYYVKELIKRDMNKKENKIEEIKLKKKRNINFDM